MRNFPLSVSESQQQQLRLESKPIEMIDALQQAKRIELLQYEANTFSS